MSTLDVPYLADQEIRSAQRMGASVVPPPYPKRRPSNPEAINNYYYNIHENRGVRWLNRKRCFWAIVAVLIAIVIAGAVVLSVVLTRRSEGEESPDEPEQTSTSTLAESHVPSTVLVTLTEMLSLSRATSVSVAESTTSTSTSTSSSERTTTTTSTTMASEASLIDDDGIGAILSSFVNRMTTVSSNSEESEPTSSAVGSVYSQSQLAATYLTSNANSRHLLFWQDEKGYLTVAEWSVYGNSQFHIRDRVVQTVDDAKFGTPLAATTDPCGAVHVFYLSTQDVITHLVERSVGEWVVGGVAIDGEPVVVHQDTRLSATWHQSKSVSKVLVLSYQTPRRKLRLLMSDKPSDDDAWYGADVETQLGHPQVAIWNGLGHALNSGWRYPVGDDNPGEGYRGLVGVVEGEGEVFPWECSVDFRMPPARHVECYWLNDTFRDSHKRPIRLTNPPTQFAWLRLEDPEVNTSGLAYEFSLLFLDTYKAIQDVRLGIGLPRKPGTGFSRLLGQSNPAPPRLGVEAIAGTDGGSLYARSGTSLFECTLVGGEWMFKGWVNTTLTEGSVRGGE